MLNSYAYIPVDSCICVCSPDNSGVMEDLKSKMLMKAHHGYQYKLCEQGFILFVL